MREKSVTRGEIDDPAAAKQPAHTTRGLPGFVQLLARKTPGLTGGAADAIQQRLAWKPRQISCGEAST